MQAQWCAFGELLNMLPSLYLRSLIDVLALTGVDAQELLK
jgi:hypothetical protein